MKEQKSGNIVIISSINGVSAMGNLAVYSSIKYALEGVVRSLAASLGPYGVRVNSCAPGVILSEMNQEIYSNERNRKAFHHPLTDAGGSHGYRERGSLYGKRWVPLYDRDHRAGRRRRTAPAHAEAGAGLIFAAVNQGAAIIHITWMIAAACHVILAGKNSYPSGDHKTIFKILSNL